MLSRSEEEAEEADEEATYWERRLSMKDFRPGISHQSMALFWSAAILESIGKTTKKRRRKGAKQRRGQQSRNRVDALLLLLLQLRSHALTHTHTRRHRFWAHCSPPHPHYSSSSSSFFSNRGLHAVAATRFRVHSQAISRSLSAVSKHETHESISTYEHKQVMK